MRTLSLVLIPALVSGCTSAYHATYGFESKGLALVHDEVLEPVPAQASCSAGTTGICTVEDARIKITWFLGARNLGALIENKTTRPLEIVWERSGFLQSGERHAHGLVLAHAPEADVPSVFMPGVPTQVDLYPAGMILITTYYDQYGPRKVITRGKIFRDYVEFSSLNSANVEEGFKRTLEQMKGVEFAVRLRVVEGDRNIDYVFPFQISQASVTRVL